MHYTPPPPTTPVRIKVLITWHRKGRRPPYVEAVMRARDAEKPYVIITLRPVGISIDELAARLFGMDGVTLVVDAPIRIWDMEQHEHESYITSVLRWEYVRRNGIPVDGRDLRAVVGL